MATADLTEINRTIRSAMGESAGTFRRAANDNSNLMSKISKEISNVFAKQRSQISALNDNIEEVALHSQQTSLKLDRLSNIMSESINIQNQISASMKSMVDGIFSTNKSILGVNNSLIGAGGIAGLLGNVFGKFGEIAGRVIELGPTIKDAILSLGTAGGAAALIAGVGGGQGGGGSSNFQWGVGPQNLNMKAAAEAIKDIESKGSGGYSAKAPGSSASGAYQFVNDTWRSASAAAGYGGKYQTARDAPPEVQDAVFNDFFQKLVKQHGLKGAVLTYFTGNPEGKLTAAQQRGNITAESYLSKFGKGYEKHSGESLSSPKPESTISTNTGSPTTSSATEQGTTPTAHADKVDQHDAQGHIISGAAQQTKEEKSATTNLPGGNIVALGHALESRGFRISEHPAFGGVKGATPDKPWGIHSRTGGHGDGTAIDINIGNNNVEEDHPEMAAKFDKLAAELRSAGYKVIWRAPNHHNHLHAQMVKGGSTGAAEPGATTPASATSGGGGGMTETSGGTPTGEEQQQTSILQSPAFQQLTGGMMGGGLEGMINKFQNSYNTGDLSGITGGAMPGMGSMLGGMGGGMMGGGIGGMMGMLGPLMGMLTSALPSGAQQPAGQMLQTMSQTVEQSQQLNRQAVEREAQNQISTEIATQAATDKAVEDTNIRNANRNEGRPISSDYNRPEDKGWPDWMNPLRTPYYDQFMGGFVKGA